MTTSPLLSGFDNPLAEIPNNETKKPLKGPKRCPQASEAPWKGETAPPLKVQVVIPFHCEWNI